MDIERSEDVDGSAYNIGWIETGEWLTYSINVVYSDNYLVKARVASLNGGGGLRLLLNNDAVTAEISIPKTDGWQNWISHDIGIIYIPQGIHEINLNIINEGFNLNQLEFERTFTGLDRYMNETRPVHFRLNQNYPNPFNVSTIITYSVSEETFVSLKISDLTGREIETLIYKKQNPGYYHVIYKAKDLASGIYFVRMKAGNFQDKKSMILMK